MKMGRYICFMGKLEVSELVYIRDEFNVYFKEDEILFEEWTVWITVPAAQSSLIRAIL